MDQSPQQQIESIIRSLEEKGRRAAPVSEANDLAASHPHAISDLAIAVMARFPKGGTFLDGALSHLPDEQWTELVQSALNTIEASSGTNDAAESVIAYASLQAPTVLHPHLTRIFLLAPNAGSYYEFYPWRESSEQHFKYLRNLIDNSSSDIGTRRRAWSALWETRQPQVIEYAIFASGLEGITPDGWLHDDWVAAHLHNVGYCQEDHGVRPLYHDGLHHIRFPETFFDAQSRPTWLARTHPSWKLPPSIQSLPFGGTSDSRCSLCGEALHRLLVLDEIPPEWGITSRVRLELATCLSCLGWEKQPLFYQHGQDGCSVNVGYDGPLVEPQFPVGPLKEGRVSLAKTPRRWFWQDWALSNSRENLNRVSGAPCWIQSAEYPECPLCGEMMPFLLQLDSDLPTEDGEEWMWGSGGIAYGFWCDRCSVSAFLWQCT